MDSYIIEGLIAIYKETKDPKIQKMIIELLENRGVEIEIWKRGIGWTIETSGYIGDSE